MALLPTEAIVPTDETKQSEQITFGTGWKFDFGVGEFVNTSTGRMLPATELEAYMEWCQKALLTPRYKHGIYSHGYGNEFEDLIGKNYSRDVIESEIKRIATEALVYDLRTSSVGNFSFSWGEDGVYFECSVVSTYGETFKTGTKVVI